MKEHLPGSNRVWRHQQHKADVPRAPDCVGLSRAAGTSPLPSGHCPLLVRQVQGAQLLAEPRGSVAGPQGSCWSWLDLPRASSSIFTLPAQLILTWRGKCRALFRWIPGSRGVLQGQPGHFGRVWAPHLSPWWGIRLPPLCPSMGLVCAGQPVPARSYLVPSDHSSLKDGIRCPRLLPRGLKD